MMHVLLLWLRPRQVAWNKILIREIQRIDEKEKRRLLEVRRKRPLAPTARRAAASGSPHSLGLWRLILGGGGDQVRDPVVDARRRRRPARLLPTHGLRDLTPLPRPETAVLGD